MGPNLHEVVMTMTADLGMGEDQGKIDALENDIEKILSEFFSEHSKTSSLIKSVAEQSFISHSARIKNYLTSGAGGGTIMEGAGTTAPLSSSNLAVGELSPSQKALLSKEQTATIYTARAILEGLMTQERESRAEHEAIPPVAGGPEPEPEGDGTGPDIFFETTPVKTGLAFSFDSQSSTKGSPLSKIADDIQDNEKLMFDGKHAEEMTALMPEILSEATTFLNTLWAGEFGDLIRETLENSGSTVSAVDTSKKLAKTKRNHDEYMTKMNVVVIERSITQSTLDQALTARQDQHRIVTGIQSKIEDIIKVKMVSGVSEDNHHRDTWGDMTDAEIAAKEAQLRRLRLEKTGMKEDIADRKDSIESQTEIISSYQNTILGVVSNMLSDANAGTANHKEKALAEIDLFKFAGDLKPDMIDSADGPETGMLFEQMITNILVTYPIQTSLIAGAFMRVFQEKQTGKHKTIPWSIANERKSKGALAKLYKLSQALVDEYCSQSGALYNVFTRFCENAMRRRNRPMKVHGTSEKSPVIYAIEGDIVMTVFMILDETEKTGWEDRNTKREYFVHSDSMVAREKSLLRAIELLRTPIPASRRMGVNVDFETMKKIAVMFTRREHGVLSDVCRKYTTRDIVGEDANCLIQLDEMLAEVAQQLEECSIDECPPIATGVHYVEVYSTFCTHANNVIGPHWRGGGGSGGGGGRNNNRNNGDDPSDLVMPAKMKDLKCGCVGCDKAIVFDKLSRGQQQRVIKKAENDWKTGADNKDTPCSDCARQLKDDSIQCNKLKLKNGKSMSWVDHPTRNHKMYKFESEANSVTTNQQNDRKHEAEPQASSTGLDLQTDGSRRSSDSDAWTKAVEKPTLQQLLDSAQDLPHRDYVVYKSKVIEMFDSDSYGK